MILHIRLVLKKIKKIKHNSDLCKRLALVIFSIFIIMPFTITDAFWLYINSLIQQTNYLKTRFWQKHNASTPGTILLKAFLISKVTKEKIFLFCQD